MNAEQTSLEQLIDFIEAFDLRDRWGNCRFQARVAFSVNGQSSVYNVMVMIFTEGYPAIGRINIVHEQLNAEDYPIEVFATYQQYTFLEGVGLQVSGMHKKNPRIGQYSFTIVPL